MILWFPKFPTRRSLLFRPLSLKARPRCNSSGREGSLGFVVVATAGYYRRGRRYHYLIGKHMEGSSRKRSNLVRPANGECICFFGNAKGKPKKQRRADELGHAAAAAAEIFCQFHCFNAWNGRAEQRDESGTMEYQMAKRRRRLKCAWNVVFDCQ